MDDPVPPYEIPAIGEAIRVYDATRWQTTVPAVYLGYEHVSGDFFMHRVRSESGAENSLASHAIFRHRQRENGREWFPLTKRPRVR